VAQLEHETAWPRSAELRQELNATRKLLIQCADILAEVADVLSLIVRVDY
jgi:hypothetical protein